MIMVTIMVTMWVMIMVTLMVTLMVTIMVTLMVVGFIFLSNDVSFFVLNGTSTSGGYLKLKLSL